MQAYIAKFPDELKKQSARVIAETATEDFKQNFTEKGFDGKPWPQAQHTPGRGSLMVRGSHLVNSIKPVTVTPNKVVISAGDSKAPYARVHNEGGVVNVPVTKKMKRWAWAKAYEAEGTEDESLYKGLALTKKKMLNITIPRRRYMGYSKSLEKKIINRIAKAMKHLKK